MMTTVERAIRRHSLIPSGCHILAGVSGGADSVALLYALHVLRGTLDFSLTAVHLHHGLRGAEADADAELVQSLAWRLGASCVVEKCDVAARARAEGVSVEMAGRAARRELFFRAARKTGADRIATAHHADDQVETLLLRLLRGTSLRGLGGMRYRSLADGMMFIRPMLDVRHEDAVAFLKAHGLVWREDASNSDTALLRNRVRHGLIPFLEERFTPSVRGNLLRTAAVLRDDEEWLDALTETLSTDCRTSAGGLRLGKLTALPVAAKRRILLEWMRGGGIPSDRLDFALLERLLAWLPQSAARLSVPNDFILERRNGVLELRGSVREKTATFSKKLQPPGSVLLLDGYLFVSATPAKGFKKTPRERWIAYVSEARRKGAPLVIRSRRPGDRMQPFGMTGSVKLQDVMVDLKIPQRDRDRIPVVTCRGEVVWLPGYRIDRRWAAASSTAPTLRLQIQHKMKLSGD